MDSKLRPRRRDGLKSRLLPDRHLVVTDLDTSSAVTLNTTAALVWEFCDGELCISQIVDEVSRVVPDLMNEEFAQQVNSVIEDLSKQGFLQLV